MAVTQPQPKPEPPGTPSKGPIELPQTIFISHKRGSAPAEPPPEPER